MKTDSQVANWTCDRCDLFEQTSVVIVGQQDISAASVYPPMPDGWAHTTIHWNQGTSLAQDLCRTCADLIDGAMSGRYDVVDPEVDVVAEEAPKAKSTRKRAAKKTAKKAT